MMAGTLDLGAFSISLTVADLDRSRDFYERLGFEVTGGDVEQGYLIMVNGPAVIGLFQGMFDRNILTFNPGIAPPTAAPDVERFTDVREIQQHLGEAGFELAETTDPDGTGPAHITLVDPDGNPILIDQFRDRPE
jgi:catechol 2,3-dioxygenase-like lactoylglutathione lyase family enzyme